VTLVAGLAGIGVLAPTSVEAELARPASFSTGAATADPSADVSLAATSGDDSGAQGSGTADVGTMPDAASTPAPEDSQRSSAVAETALPAGSGAGRRIVFSERLQRVWLVGAHDSTQRTYLVSGSVTDNLQPGTYSVYSRSRWAVGIDDSGVMEYFVRFTQGPTGAAIGFHTIPTRHEVPLQSKAELGAPHSHGCIRQATPDALALWNFAPVGTKVVVVA
jgi:hypothetical protein